MMRAAGAHPRAQGPTQSPPQPPRVHRGIDCALKHRPQRHGAPSSKCRASPYRAGGGGLVGGHCGAIGRSGIVKVARRIAMSKNHPQVLVPDPPLALFAGRFPSEHSEGSSRDCGKGAGGAEVFGGGSGRSRSGIHFAFDHFPEPSSACTQHRRTNGSISLYFP